MHADTATRQHWMSVLAHSQPAELAARLNALNITADYEVLMTIGPNRNRAVVSWTPLTRDGGQMLSRKYQLYPMTAEREVPVGQ